MHSSILIYAASLLCCLSIGSRGVDANPRDNNWEREEQQQLQWERGLPSRPNSLGLQVWREHPERRLREEAESLEWHFPNQKQAIQDELNRDLNWLNQERIPERLEPLEQKMARDLEQTAESGW